MFHYYCIMMKKVKQMKIDEEKVRRLRQETGKDYEFCQKALIKCRNDYDRAVEYIDSYDERFFVRTYRHFMSIGLGEKSYRFIITNNGEDLIDIPLIIPLVICIILPISSIVLAFMILAIMLTDSSMTLDVKKSSAEETNEKIISKPDTEKPKAKPVSPVLNEVTVDEDGYSTVEIL